MYVQRRIVVTGMGVISPLGCGVEAVWARLLGGRSGLRRLPQDFAPDLPCQVVGRVPFRDEDPVAGLDLNAVVSFKEQRRSDRFIHFALAAAGEALRQANWPTDDEIARCRTATVIGSSVGGFPAIAHAVRTTDTIGVRRLSPYSVPSFLPNLAAGAVSIRHSLKGPIGAPAGACAASVQAIADGARLIRAGEAEVAVCGGADAVIHEVSLGAFAAARALSTGFNDEPERASRPFDQQRDGFVMSEGAAVLVLEAYDHAMARGVVPLAEVAGWGLSADAHHVTAGSPDGDGAVRAMLAALAQAGVAPEAVGHVNAHATSTPWGDQAELAALRRVFHDASPSITSTKSATGHLLGAAGALEAIFSILALRDQVAPPTLNLDAPDEAAAGLNLIGKTARAHEMEFALSNAFGFGGVNGSLLFRRPPE
ncbi:MAG: 3-oxoacyl-ACP synthase [Caulobacter sp.]|nr:3-oxoacyl-ACP synthase [Caulobacter sp.]